MLFEYIESSNYGSSNCGGLFIRNCMANFMGPEQVVRIVESSNYGAGSNYGGSTVLKSLTYIIMESFIFMQIFYDVN